MMEASIDCRQRTFIFLYVPRGGWAIYFGANTSLATPAAVTALGQPA